MINSNTKAFFGDDIIRKLDDWRFLFEFLTKSNECKVEPYVNLNDWHINK